jgi:myosin-5
MSSSDHGIHVWVRTDLVEAILNNNGVLPMDWKPRKRARSSMPTDWGWCRAQISSATTGENSPERKNKAPEHASPFNVKLRKVGAQKTPALLKQRSSWRGSPDKNMSQKVTVALTVDDVELAPSHLQHACVTFTYDTAEVSKVCSANTWWLSSDETEGPPEDLTQLEQLHEPAVVFCLLRRYQYDQIYTYTGKILLALNPFRPLNELYSEETMKLYWQIADYDNEQRPPPHIYAIAEDAYRSMHANAQLNGGPQNQSILVSGESGAGKTVTTKIIMRYLATLSSKRVSQLPLGNGIESMVLQSNTILESFGNARTIRNDNSSRFGKFIEIRFSQSGCLDSAAIETYLLEKVRLISQAAGERNYHIFYELLAGLSQKDRRDLVLGTAGPHDFRMTASSGTFDRRDGVGDRDTFRDLLTALDTMRFSSKERQDVFAVVCGLLHASNLTFRENTIDSSELDRSNPSLKPTVALLGVDVCALNEACCRCAIDAGGEVLYKHLTVGQAHKAVEALIKITYGALFTYIVRRVNSSIGTSQSSTAASISVLDIFGFESFDVNSFEQLCIK